MNLVFSYQRLCIFFSFVGFMIYYVFKSMPVIEKGENGTFDIEKQVWCLYLGVFGNPVKDGRWVHWRIRLNKYYGDYFEPPGRLGTFLYPQMGLYSSHDISTLRHHCSMMKEAGIDSVILQWWGTNSSEELDEDAEGFSDKTFALLLDVVGEFGLKAGIQIQPYNGRSNSSLASDIMYILTNYSTHESYLKVGGRPVIIVYEPHGIEGVNAVQSVFKDRAFMIASIIDKEHIGFALEDGFDGIYTYFASEGSTWGSNISNWNIISSDCQTRGLVFIPAVAPGYNDEKINHWGRGSKRNRESGRYYERMWNGAIDVNPSIVVINSFNHWYEGSMIEPAISRSGMEFSDDSWSGKKGNPEDFLLLTKNNVDKFKNDNK